MIDRIGMPLPRQRASSRYEPAITISPIGDPERVVLDPARLDLAQPAARVDGGRADGVDRPVDDLAIEPPAGGRDPPADDHEQEMVELVEPPLVERCPVQERDSRRELTHALRAGRPADRTDVDAEQPPADDQADGRDRDAREDQRTVDAEQRIGGLGGATVQDLLALGEDRRQPLADPVRAERQPEVHPEEDRRDRQQDQRHGHHRRRLVDPVPDLFGAAERAPERQPHEPEHVERGQAGDDEADQPDPSEPLLERFAQDLVLGEEAGQRRDAGDRQRADQHRQVGDRDLLAPGRPCLRMSCSSWTAWMTDPESRNSRPLKKPWVIRWKMAAVHAPTPNAANM